ncbi:MAG TPA: hypothetical protein HPP50_06825 [Rhodospirillaceae bacterium]|jgi:hypothetical protein|nr:hypothetical protein [Rhodospirillaceae bacterium]HIJ45853.1 hypothetical protein [Rhodospirillaceae bacterium]HJP53576.1 hypothetical protein [Rhodospirillales bacterium]
MTKRKMPDGARQNGPALEKAYKFALWLVPTVEKSWTRRCQNRSGANPAPAQS